MIHIWRPWKLSNFQDPSPRCPSTSKILPHPWTWTSNFKRTPSPNENQSIKRKHNPRMTIKCYQVLPSGRLSFSVFNLSNLSGFPLASFNLAAASLFAFSWLYALVRAVVQKYHQMSFIHNYSQFSTHFAINLFICTTWKLKQTMKQQSHRACERTKSKQKQNQVTSHSNWPRDLLFYI